MGKMVKMKKDYSSEIKLLSDTSLQIVESEPDNGWYGFYRQQQLPRLSRDLEVLLGLVQKGQSVLDVGANPPFLIATLAQLGFDASGIDLNPAAFQKTIDRYGLRVNALDIERDPLPFEDNSFDYLLFTEVIEHLRINPVFTMSELYRVLKPGGVLMLETPNLYSLNGIYNFLVKGRAYACCNNDIYSEFSHYNVTGFFGHIREYTSQELHVFLKKLGFRDLKAVYSDGGKLGWTKPVYSVFPHLRSRIMLLGTK